MCLLNGGKLRDIGVHRGTEHVFDVFGEQVGELYVFLATVGEGDGVSVPEYGGRRGVIRRVLAPGFLSSFIISLTDCVCTVRVLYIIHTCGLSTYVYTYHLHALKHLGESVWLVGFPCCCCCVW